MLLSCLEWIIQKLTACDKAVLKEDQHPCKIAQDSDSPQRPDRLNDSTQALLQAIIWEQDLQVSASHDIANKILHFSHSWQQYIFIAAHFLASCRLFQVLTDGKHSPGKEHFLLAIYTVYSCLLLITVVLILSYVYLSLG